MKVLGRVYAPWFANNDDENITVLFFAHPTLPQLRVPANEYIAARNAMADDTSLEVLSEDGQEISAIRLGEATVPATCGCHHHNYQQ